MKTDNSYFNEKVQLRIDSLPDNDEIFVLDCFAGTGRIWDEVKKRSKKNINILSIEKEPGKNKTALVGSNLKYLNVLNLNKFDIIDLNAYGIPYSQLNIIFKRGYHGIIHITAIQTGMGQLPRGLIRDIGYTNEMMKKINSIFNTKGIEKLKNYLYLHGVQTVEGYFIERKNYFYFNLNQETMKIYEPAGKAREYSPLALNYFKGCDHGCLYCYCPPMLKRFNSSYDHSKVSCDLNLDELEKSILKLSKEDRQKQVLLSFTSDPYCGFESGQTRQVLEVLLKHQVHVAILTKNPEKAIKDIDIFKKFEHFKIGSTLTFFDVKKSMQWEPGASTPCSRINGLRYFSENNIKTWVSFEPVIEPSETLELIKEIIPFIDHVKIGKLNNYKGLDKDVDWCKFLFDSVYLLRNSTVKFYIKKGLAEYNNGLYLSGNELNEDYLNI